MSDDYEKRLRETSSEEDFLQIFSELTGRERIICLLPAASLWTILVEKYTIFYLPYAETKFFSFNVTDDEGVLSEFRQKDELPSFSHRFVQLVLALIQNLEESKNFALEFVSDEKLIDFFFFAVYPQLLASAAAIDDFVDLIGALFNHFAVPDLVENSGDAHLNDDGPSQVESLLSIPPLCQLFFKLISSPAIAAVMVDAIEMCSPVAVRESQLFRLITDVSCDFTPFADLFATPATIDRLINAFSRLRGAARGHASLAVCIDQILYHCSPNRTSILREHVVDPKNNNLQKLCAAFQRSDANSRALRCTANLISNITSDCLNAQIAFSCEQSMTAFARAVDLSVRPRGVAAKLNWMENLCATCTSLVNVCLSGTESRRKILSDARITTSFKIVLAYVPSEREQVSAGVMFEMLLCLLLVARRNEEEESRAETELWRAFYDSADSGQPRAPFSLVCQEAAGVGEIIQILKHYAKCEAGIRQINNMHFLSRFSALMRNTPAISQEEKEDCLLIIQKIESNLDQDY